MSIASSTNPLPAGGRPSPYTPYRQTLLTKQQVRAFSELQPWRPVLDALLCWAWIVVAWAAVAVVREWWVILLAIPVIGTRYYGLFIIGHDGMHKLAFPGQKLNDLFIDVCVLGPIGAINRINKRNHLLHHQHLSSEQDPDRHKHCCYNKSRRLEYLFFFSGFASLIPLAANVFFRERAAASTMPPVDKTGAGPPRPRESYLLRDLALLLGWQAVLIAGLTLAIGWWAYPVLWLFPVYAFAYLGDLVRSFLEHSQPEADDKADEHRLITYTSNRIERLFFAPMNMNYHTVHHLWTSIPYYNLPAADRVIGGQPGAAGLTWRGSYIGYILRYYSALPLLECRRRRQIAQTN